MFLLSALILAREQTFCQVVLPILFSTKKKDSLIKSEILLLSDLCFYHVFLQKGYFFLG